MPLSRQPLTIGQQAERMRADFPTFQLKRFANIPSWQGYLQPRQTSVKYLVRIEYRKPKAPRVWVLEPQLAVNVPHRYSDDSLCLYYPKDNSWSSYRFISQTIVPWTALWLAFYELWLKTGVWYGKEAPHGRRKLRH